jgi:hypothetical protein
MLDAGFLDISVPAFMLSKFNPGPRSRRWAVFCFDRTSAVSALRFATALQNHVASR